ncbi:MAG TPA: SAP domain-containing protein [Methanoregulaceae archaeon]|nr:SAP domain-containing protein [Methanoregulaceae archaeon]
MKLSNGINYQFSKAHLLLLSKFLYPRKKDYYGKINEWLDVLHQPSEEAIETLLEEGLLREASLQEKIDCQFYLNELKSMLKEKKLPTSGKKALLIERLITADESGMKSLVGGESILICSEKGRLIAEEYLEREHTFRQNTEQIVLNYLLNGNYPEAIGAVISFEAKQVFQRGMGIDWKNYNSKSDENILQFIFSNTPKILNEYSREEIEILRPAAAMMYLWGTNIAKNWIPIDFPTSHRYDADTAARMILFHALTLNSIYRYKEWGYKSVEILTTHDSCENCKRHSGKIFDINSIIELPNPECTHPYGCRCDIFPKFS